MSKEIATIVPLFSQKKYNIFVEKEKYKLIGPLIGDIYGFYYENHFYVNEISRIYPFLKLSSNVSDDSILTIATMEYLLDKYIDKKNVLYFDYLYKYFSKYPNNGFGSGFTFYMYHCGNNLSKVDKNNGYGSKGNGCLMRISPIPYFFVNDYDKMIEEVKLTTNVTHNDPESIFCSVLFSEIIYHLLNKTYKTLDDLYQEIVINKYNFEMNEISQSNIKSPKVQDTLEIVLNLFFNKEIDNNTEKLIETIIKLNGDTDTLLNITLALNEAYLGYLDDKYKEDLFRVFTRRKLNDLKDVFLKFNSNIE